VTKVSVVRMIVLLAYRWKYWPDGWFEP